MGPSNDGTIERLARASSGSRPRPFLALSPRPAVLSPRATAARGPLNDVVVTTTRIRRRGCHNDVVAVEPRPPLSIIRLPGGGIGPQLAGPMDHGGVSQGGTARRPGPGPSVVAPAPTAALPAPGPAPFPWSRAV